MPPVDLIKPPQKIFRSSVHIVAAGIVWEVVDQWGAAKLLLEQIDLIEEQDDAGSHEPSRVHHRIEKYQTFHHAILVFVIRVLRGE